MSAHKNIPVLLQTSDFIAVDKPAGISVHNNEDPENLILVLGKNFPEKKLYPVHRLDKETSGVQIFALNEIAAKKLANEFQTKSIEKIYVGVLRGQLKTQGGIWNQTLTDKAEGRKSPAGSNRDRVPCETRFKVIQSNKYFSYCEFNLITGRQHQIRKHSCLHNHPIVGDGRYGEPKYNQRMAEIYKNDRMFLHCHRLTILEHKIVSPIPILFEKLFKDVAHS